VFTRKGGEAFAANGGAGYGSYGTSSVFGGLSGGGAGRGACGTTLGKRAIGKAKASTPSPTRSTSATTPTAMAIGTTMLAEACLFALRRSRRFRRIRSRLNAQFDAGPGFDDRTVTTVESYSIASRNRLANCWTSELKAAETGDDSNSETALGPSRFRTRQRLYSWQNELRPGYGALTIIAERREEVIDSDAGFAGLRATPTR
jgi:vitamin B12 transporter